MPQKYKKYKKPFLFFLGAIIIFGSSCLISFLAFNSARSNKQQDVSIIPTPTAETAKNPSLYPNATAYPKNPSAAYPTFSPTASPTNKPSPIPTATPKPTGTIFNIVPLAIFNPSETQVLAGNPSLDGYRSSDGGGSTTMEIWVGRNNVATFRGFVNFDLKLLPSNITIEKAILKITQLGWVGNPYTVGGNVVVDHLDYGSSLDATDYNRAAIQLHIGVLSDNATFEEKKLEVTDSVKNDLYYKRGSSQYRLRFATETIGGKSSGDIAWFLPEKNIYDNNKSPRLEITFKKN